MAKKIFAIAGIVLLAAIYISTLVFALIDNPYTLHLVGASVGATVIIPVLMWSGMMIFRKRDITREENEAGMTAGAAGYNPEDESLEDKEGKK